MCCEVHFESESAENTKRLSEIIGAKNVIGYDAEVIGAGNYCLCPVDVEASCALAGIVVTQDFDADEHWAIPGDWVVAFGPAPPPTKGETP